MPTRPGSIPRHPQGKEKVHSPDKTESVQRAGRALLVKLVFKKVYITIYCERHAFVGAQVGEPLTAVGT